ncbi:MAG: hypothetical protein QM608_04790 [Caulobacter sp.]
MAMVPTLGRDLMAAKLAAAEGRVARFMWTGALANGAALVALVGVIGNVPDPDAALTALGVPILIYAIGICAGGWAGGHLAAIGELEVQISTDVALYEAALPAALSRSLEDLQLTLAIIEGRFYGEALPSPRNMRQAKERLEAVAKFVGVRAAGHADKKKQRVKLLTRWVLVSFGCFLASTLLIVGGHMVGARLQPPKEKAVVAVSPPTKAATPTPTPRPSPARPAVKVGPAA